MGGFGDGEGEVNLICKMGWGVELRMGKGSELDLRVGGGIWGW